MKKVVLSTPTAWILILISFVFCFIYAIIMEIVLSCNYKDAEQLQVLLVFITFEVTRMPNYKSITLREDLHIRKIYSIHYFEYMKDYVFDGESHDFWEFVFVDSGNLFVTAGDKEVLLASNEMIFHKPNEFHALRETEKLLRISS